MKRISIAAIVFCAASLATSVRAAPVLVPPAHRVNAETSVERAFKDRASDIQVRGEGTVVRLLADDNEGSRHQRFIVALASGQTVLIAHNVDVAPRVAGLERGHRVRFCGEYVWSAKGGLVHWTHRDPQGRHAAGWIEYNGRVYG